MILSFGFKVPSPVLLTCSAARAPMPVCLDTGYVMVRGTVPMEVTSSPQQAAVWTQAGAICQRKWLQHPWISVFLVLTVPHFPYSGTFCSFRFPWWSVVIIEFSKPFNHFQSVSDIHSGITHFKNHFHGCRFIISLWDGITTLCVWLW
jgi:hypothetical protein